MVTDCFSPQILSATRWFTSICSTRMCPCSILSLRCHSSTCQIGGPGTTGMTDGERLLGDVSCHLSSQQHKFCTFFLFFCLLRFN